MKSLKGVHKNREIGIRNGAFYCPQFARQKMSGLSITGSVLGSFINLSNIFDGYLNFIC